MSIYESIIKGLDEAIEYEKSGKNGRKVKCTVQPAPRFTPQEIKSVRNTLGMTQVTFAALMGVSVKTVEAWETGTNKPIGSACRMLGLLQSDPSIPAKYHIVTE